MAKRKLPAGISEYMAEIGREGGRSKVPKGTSMMSDEKRREIALKGVAARRDNAKKAGKKAAKQAT